MPASIRALASRIRAWLSPDAIDRDFEQEVAADLEMLTEEHVRRGMAPEAAARAARIRMGGLTQLREIHRDARGLPSLDSLLQDMRYAFRMLRKTPGFTTVAVLTLAIGIGANTAIFSVVYAVLLKPLPYTRADQLFTVFQIRPQAENRGTGWSYANFADLREQNRVFSEIAGSQHHQLTLTGQGDPLAVDTSVVTPELFSVFDGTPLAGRTFSAEDGRPGAPPVVILSEGLWRDRFGADASIVGRAIDLDARAFTVVGIMPDAFRFPLITQSEQIWIPLAQDPLFGSWMPRRGGHWLQVTGRLKPGVSVAQAQAELDALGERFGREFPADSSGWAIRMVPLQRMIVGDVQSALIVLLGAVGLVLLIACANIANLLLTRATLRTREIALRTALGAGRARIARQLLSETAALGLCGGAAGIALAYAGVRALGSLVPANVPRVNAIRVDTTVLLFALALSAIASVAFGLVPALFAARADPHAGLREGGRAGESAGRRRARQALAAAEVALALVLLVASGLLLRSFANLLSTNPGFAAEHVLKAEVSLPRFGYAKPEQWRLFADELLGRIEAEPGLAESAVAIPAPIADGFVNLGFDIVGVPPPSANVSRTADYVAVSPSYLRVMGIPLLSGRFFDAHDRPATARVCVISATFARAYFPGQDPLGRHLNFGFPPDPGGDREIVGIVGDVRDVALDRDPGAMMYVPFAQAPFPGAVVLVKSSQAASSIVAAIRKEVAAIDRSLPVTDVGMMPDLIDASLAQPKFRTFLLGLFAAMALVLAATGIFGVISYSVSCRTHEIGVRVALGASRGAILTMVMRETLILAGAGFVVGLPCALAASRVVGHMLFGVSAHDPLTLGAVSCALVAVAALAGYLPARRATRVVPMIALRQE